MYKKNNLLNPFQYLCALTQVESSLQKLLPRFPLTSMTFGLGLLRGASSAPVTHAHTLTCVIFHSVSVQGRCIFFCQVLYHLSLKNTQIGFEQVLNARQVIVCTLKMAYYPCDKPLLSVYVSISHCHHITALAIIYYSFLILS